MLILIIGEQNLTRSKLKLPNSKISHKSKFSIYLDLLFYSYFNISKFMLSLYILFFFTLTIWAVYFILKNYDSNFFPNL